MGGGRVKVTMTINFEDGTPERALAFRANRAQPKEDIDKLLLTLAQSAGDCISFEWREDEQYTAYRKSSA
jgi:hypothetical protein